MLPLTQFKRFDVRDLIRRGVEPFPEIHKRVNALKPDEGLIVVAPFLPSPLVEKLNGDGFAAKVEKGNGADWLIYFWREAGEWCVKRDARMEFVHGHAARITSRH